MDGERATLTDEEIAGLRAWRGHWLQLGTDTALTNRSRAESAITALYRDLGYHVPRFLWVDSPRAARSRLSFRGWGHHHEYGDSLVDRLVWAVVSTLQVELDRSLSLRVKAQVLTLLGQGNELGWQHEPWQSMRLTVYRSLLRAPHLYQMFPGPADRGPTVDGGITGHNLAWTAYLTCGPAILGLRYSDRASARLALWTEVARACGWWWPRQHLCVICERPAAIHRDASDRLHHPRGAALCFRDDFAVFAWHGTWVPGEWITEPHKLAPWHALQWPNLEERRAAAEMLGWQRVLAELQPRTLDRDPDPTIGELLEVVLPGGGAARFLRVRCGTGREFVLRVPPQAQSAREANSWTYGLRPEDYTLEART